MPRHSTYHEPDVVSGRAKTLRTLTSTGWETRHDVRTFQAQCACGYRGPVRTSPHEADDDCVVHRQFENYDQ